MARLVVGDQRLLLEGEDLGLLLKPADDAVDRVAEVGKVDALLLGARRDEGRLARVRLRVRVRVGVRVGVRVRVRVRVRVSAGRLVDHVSQLGACLGLGLGLGLG